MKKLSLILAVVMIMIVMLCSCNNGQKSGNVTTTTESEYYDDGYESRTYTADDYDINDGLPDEIDTDDGVYFEFLRSHQRKCGDYIVFDFKDGVGISRYLGTETNLVIPETIDGKKVRKIGVFYHERSEEFDYGDDLPGSDDITNAFKYCKLEYVTIPKTINYLAQGTFGTAESRQDFDKTLKKIYVDKDNESFSSIDGILYNKNVTELIMIPAMYEKDTVTLPDTVLASRNDAFAMTYNVRVLNINANFKQLFSPEFSFSPDGNLSYGFYSQINVDKNNKYFSSVDGVLFNKQMTKLLAYPNYKPGESYKTPDSITSFDTYNNLFIFAKYLDTISVPKEISEFFVGMNFANYDEYTDEELVELKYEFGTKSFEEKCNITTIKGYKGTAAETFAKENNLKFVALD